MDVLVVSPRFWLRSHLPFQNLPFTWVCSLSLHSLNALFENCLSVREAVLRTQKQMCGHSDIKMTCAEFKTLTHTNVHAITHTGVRTHMFDGFTSLTVHQTRSPDKTVTGEPFLPFSLLTQCWTWSRGSGRQGQQRRRVERRCLYENATCVIHSFTESKLGKARRALCRVDATREPSWHRHPECRFHARQ